MSGNRKVVRLRDVDRKAIMEAVCVRVAEGELVKFACQAEGISPRTVREWAVTDKDLAPLYARAREAQAHALAEQAIEIADGEDALTQLYEQAIKDEDARLESAEKNRSGIIAALRGNAVNRDRMRLDARKWLTSKIAPKLYGERLELAGEGGGPVQVTVRFVSEGRRITRPTK